MARIKKLPPLAPSSMLLKFVKQDAVAAVILLIAALSAFIIANSGLNDWYEEVWHEHAGIVIGDFRLDQSLHHWVNDGLMAIFFFLVGLEIKRELIYGELASLRRAALPVIAAFGGMVVPAAIYAAINWGQPSVGGWGIPMATDIAFATGCLALGGKRIPPALPVFLMALAIADDIGAVSVIALFYSDNLAMRPLLMGGGLLVLSMLISRLGVRNTWAYVAIFAVVWFEFLQSGVHATIAGVLLAFTIPADAVYPTRIFTDRMTELLNRFRGIEDHEADFQVTGKQQHMIRALRLECLHVEAPLQRIEHALHPFSVLLIMPIFAFANSGVHLDWAHISDLATERVTLGVFLGLLFGKQIGVTLFSWVAVKLGLAQLPSGVTWVQVYAVSWLAGIGFTVALFVNELAFNGPKLPEIYLTEGKIGIFAASIVSAIGGIIIMRLVCNRPAPKSA